MTSGSLAVPVRSLIISCNLKGLGWIAYDSYDCIIPNIAQLLILLNAEAFPV